MINGALHLEETSFVKAKSEPTERLVFERSTAVALAPARDIQWDDVGAWNAVQKISTRNEHGNVINGDVFALDTQNSLIQSDSRLVAVIGLRDMIVVDTPDALLVMNRDHAQSVKQVVEHLKGMNRPEVSTHLLRDTNWGQVELLAKDDGYDMRMLVIAPGASLRVNGTGIFTPAEKSEISTATSVRVSSRCDCSRALNEKMWSAMGPSTRPTAR